MISSASTTVDLYPFFIGQYSLHLLPRFPSAFPLFTPIVPSTPYPTTPVSGDRAPIRDSRPRHSRGHEACLSPVIVMTFWYVFWNGLNFFKLFIIQPGLITTPHVLYDHMIHVYFLIFLCFILHTITWPREVIIVL